MPALPVDLTLGLLAAAELALVGLLAYRVYTTRPPFEPAAQPLSAGAPVIRPKLRRIAPDTSSARPGPQGVRNLNFDHWLERLEQTAAGIAALQEEARAVDNTRCVEADALKEAVEALRAGQEQLALQMRSLAQSVESLARHVAALEAAGSTPAAGVSQPAEQPETPLRIETEQEEPAAPEPAPPADQPAARPGAPRIISRESRLKLAEVLSLWKQGRTSSQIAMMTGLDSAEIELMVAGEPDPGGQEQ